MAFHELQLFHLVASSADSGLGDCRDAFSFVPGIRKI